MSFPVANFPSVAAAIDNGIRRRLHTGVQIYVSRRGIPVLDSAIGDASPGRPMTTSTSLPWRSAGKPLTALLVLKQVEDGRLNLSTPLEDVLERTRETDKAKVTVSDLLTHQSGFPNTDTGWPHADWSASITRIIDTPRQFAIGTAAYHPQSSWFLLGEILKRSGFDSSTASLASLIRTDRPVLPDPEDASDRVPVIYEREKGELRVSPWCREPWLTRESPGGNLRGPIRELGWFYEMLLYGGRLRDGRPFVSEATAGLMTTRHRIGMYDQTMQHVIDFGYGVICDSNRYGRETVPYGYGQFCSDTTFGHGGSQCSMGFCDPERELVVAWSSNGFCGEGPHQRRNRMINESVYHDLGFA